jgi:hypothetical protein
LNDLKMIVTPDECTMEGLGKAMVLGQRALECLPVTPVVAAGFNIRHTTESLHSELAKATMVPIESLDELDLSSPAAWTLGRKIPYSSGVINISTTIDGESMTVELNFHRHSTDNMELKKWLGQDLDVLKDLTDRILCGLAEIDIKEVGDDSDK